MLGRLIKRKKTIKRKLKKIFSEMKEHYSYPRYLTIEKGVGETPLEATERLRKLHNLPSKVPMAYAGRLDPMASGKLLVLIGHECKKQEKYHGLDKEYEVELLCGVSSDSGDVLGIISDSIESIISKEDIHKTCSSLKGVLSLPFPKFSAKTVQGKPLHTWTLEGRIDEITIPTQTSTIFNLQVKELKTVSKEEILSTVRKKIDSIPEVTDTRKALGKNFRREDVHASWNTFEKTGFETYQLLSFTCVASSGTYMRSLCERIATDLGTRGLAYSIHRTQIGKLGLQCGSNSIWFKRY